MTLNPFDYLPQLDDFEDLPKLTEEFNPRNIMMLAAKQRTEQARQRRRSWLASLGHWLIKLGRRLQHAAYPRFFSSHMKPGHVHIHSHRRRR
jgi:hypothetical protein